jgi:hypothetical protein
VAEYGGLGQHGDLGQLVSTERDDLDALLKTPGWLRLLERARKDWTEGYPAKIKLAITKAQQERSDVSAAVAAVDAASDAVNAVLSWPADRVKQLTAMREPAIPMARGGYEA